MPRLVEAIFAFLQRNSDPLTDYFRMPRDKVVEIGREFASILLRRRGIQDAASRPLMRPDPGTLRSR